jgi:DnaJ-class molecular chaperone
MKCACKRCDGAGTIECPVCEGSGTCESGIEVAKLRDSMDHFDELKELQEDARRVLKQCDRIKILNPKYAKQYESQRDELLVMINACADKLK